MMETKVWMILCALLLAPRAPAQDGGPAGASPTLERAFGLGLTGVSETPPVESAPGSSLNDTHRAAAPALNDSSTTTVSNNISSKSINTTTAAGETTSVTPRSQEDNDTSTASSPQTGIVTVELSPQPRILPTEQSTPTPHSPPNVTSTSPTHTSHTAPAHSPLHSDATSPPTHSSTSPVSHTSSLTSEPPSERHHAPSESTAASASTPATPASSTTSHQETLSSQATTLATTHGSSASAKSTFSSPGTPSAQAKSLSDVPSQLNVGDDTIAVHKSPNLDPLLAGLVSAFVITAVIITLLLFLKFRRRDNRPEFQRLQDLPMDDMMEDTPLSMYSY